MGTIEEEFKLGNVRLRVEEALPDVHDRLGRQKIKSYIPANPSDWTLDDLAVLLELNRDAIYKRAERVRTKGRSDLLPTPYMTKPWVATNDAVTEWLKTQRKLQSSGRQRQQLDLFRNVH